MGPEARSRIYWFLGQLYLERPDDRLLETLRGLPREAPWGPLREAVRGESAESLAVEFTRLFRGIREGYGPPPPYESLYREGRIMGQSTLDVMERYRQAGFGIIEPSAGPQDHLGVELRFMAMLCLEEMEAAGRDEGDEVQRRLAQQRDFLISHLGAWLPHYRQVLVQACKKAFYREAVCLTEAFVASEVMRLESLEEKEAI
ncbi:MAG: hypothetical protein D6819_04930 [Gammaproteobacteria bacterium]|nr:MAG: hypothetical protein D6819_04930 [Gammaproteobacteria bacterium]